MIANGLETTHPIGRSSLGALFATVFAWVAFAVAIAPPAGSQELDDYDPVSEVHAQWLMEIEPLITAEEKRFFVALRHDYQRDAFIHEFWKVRDPYPRTARNELKERWPLRLAEAKSKWQTLEDDRSRIFLVHGPPAGIIQVKCTETRIPVEVWAYRGTAATDVQTVLIFVRQSDGIKRLWRPGFSGPGIDQALRRARNCLRGQEMTQLISAINSGQSEYEQRLMRLLLKPRPASNEWIYSFVALSTDLPADAKPVPGEVEIIYPARHQHRTVVQGLVTLDTSDVKVAEYAGYRSYDFQLNGEVLKDGQLLENFRYKFGFPADQAPARLPLGFQRFLRPGNYRIVLRVDDLNSDSMFRVERQIAVPQASKILDLPAFQDPETQKLFAEATAALASGETSLRLIPPNGELHTGFTRFDALVSGDEIEKIRFVLDEKRLLTKNRPPYQVSIDLGEFPDLRLLRAEGVNAKGDVVAEDQLLINSGGYRFTVKLREPRAGKVYESSLRAQVDVEVPDGRTLERLELYVNEDRVAVLYQEPFVQPLTLPSVGDVAYVRAVGYLSDGNTTEDLVFINAPGEIEEVDVQFVELFTSVIDRQGRPVTELTRDQFSVSEDGVAQKILRFEQVENLPIHVGILIDTSASMVGVLDDVRRSALSFIDQAVSPKDRAAVITFNNFPELKVELTNDHVALGAGLAGLSPEGRTALYDSIMFNLYYFTGIKGQRAILILSDGKDESSRFDFEQTLEYARRAGITLYTIGLRLGDGGARNKLSRLAAETGGSSHFITNIDELPQIYTTIQQELRSQLLIAYQSTNTAAEDQFRRVVLEVDRSDLTPRTISGYYP